MKSTKAIRKELAILIKEKLKLCSTEQEENLAVNKARQEINLKYGKGWREQDWIGSKVNNKHYDDTPNEYTDHPNGEYWME